MFEINLNILLALVCAPGACEPPFKPGPSPELVHALGAPPGRVWRDGARHPTPIEAAEMAPSHPITLSLEIEARKVEVVESGGCEHAYEVKSSHAAWHDVHTLSRGESGGVAHAFMEPLETEAVAVPREARD